MINSFRSSQIAFQALGNALEVVAFLTTQLYTVPFTERSRGEPYMIWMLVRKRTFLN
ncbi:hypothetical protein [uncultured Algoriphagus sp.]|uniref:hypothetical protein n=1 Tax=uncultured Algoriphagus sp. TaxID=417365 RepID=UPI00258D166C|nr:hypothetical protein [uncultured Algoriphagus sp.]